MDGLGTVEMVVWWPDPDNPRVGLVSVSDNGPVTYVTDELEWLRFLAEEMGRGVPVTFNVAKAFLRLDGWAHDGTLGRRGIQQLESCLLKSQVDGITVREAAERLFGEREK